MDIGSKTTVGRRSVLKGLGAAGLAGVLPTVGNAGDTSPSIKGRDDEVSTSTATNVAKRSVRRYSITRPEYSEWIDASVDTPRTFYTLTAQGNYEPATYLFPVKKEGWFGQSTVVGYIAIAARRSWPPVLAHSTSPPPGYDRSTVEAEIEALEVSQVGKPLYQGGLNFGLQLGGSEMYHFGTQQKMIAAQESDILAFDTDDRLQTTARRQWDRMEEASTGREIASASRSGSNRVGFTDYAWDAHTGEGVSGSDSGRGTGNRNDCYSCKGRSQDPWDDWDGCIPIAGTQIIMYHEGIKNRYYNADKREEICDELHMEMKTGQDVNTSFRNIPHGFKHHDIPFLSNDYGASNELNISKGLFTSDIDKGMPLMINRPADTCVFDVCIESEDADQPSTNKKKGGNYDGHTVVAAGYRNGGNELEVFPGWNANRHTVTYGNWGRRAQVTRVWTK